ncbi:MAG: MutS protein msh4 [Pleopsidium flavum]|nr:MAG: MutS protein msh4 [Pleopsidium flavum]
MAPTRTSTSYTSASTSYPTTSRPPTGHRSRGRPRTGRPRTAASSAGGIDQQQIICAISESRGISPTVGLAFINLSTTEAVLCQICDSQTYVRTVQKLGVFAPTELLFMSTAANPKSKLYSIIEENMPDLLISVIDRKYWAETTGHEYIQQLAFKEDAEAIKVSIGGNYFAACCFAAALKYIELGLSLSFPFHSLRIKYEPSEGSMMIDLSTIQSLELIQNLQDAKSKDCLFGLLNETLTPMGSRLLRSNLLQPSTETEVIKKRYDAVEELTTKEEMFYAVRQALKSFLDVDRVLTALIIIPLKPSMQFSEQSINNVIQLKQYVNAIKPVYEAMTGAKSELLLSVRDWCTPGRIEQVQEPIDHIVNEDITFQSRPLDLRNQRTYAVKSGVNGLLDVARQTYKEANADVYELITELGQAHELALEAKYDGARGYYIHIPTSELEERSLPEIFINVFKRRNMVECQTLDLMKLNQKIMDSHHEVVNMSDRSIQELIDEIRGEMSILFKVCESIAMLDMLASFAQLVTTQDYARPELTDTLAIKAGRHPIREKIHADKFVPNDAYAAQQSRFQIITGCNMSGKSTYIRSIALMAVMAQIGSFVPAQYASFPISHQLFARVSMDDSIEANVSTFAAEMRETAFILRNIDKRSMVIIDELGRGTSTRDGLAIAIAVAEALVESRSLVWFATHFRDLAKIMAERNGVVNLHLAVEMTEADTMTMLYRVADGWVQEEHYGLALAKVVDLPPQVIEVATEVSKKLKRNIERRKKSSRTITLARRRKLILNLKEQLVQARDGAMEGKVLRSWLKKLQDEFVLRMSAIDAEVAAAEEESDEEDTHVEEEGRSERSRTRETTAVSSELLESVERTTARGESFTDEEGRDRHEEVALYTDSIADFTNMIKD